MDLEMLIDHHNARFIDWAKEQLRDLSPYDTESLEWLMMEHYQLSYQNTKFLSTAAETTNGFNSDAVSKELARNYNEESGHAVIYKAALKKVGSDVDMREEFRPTSAFLKSIGELVERSPSCVLGAMFATETAAHPGNHHAE